MGWQGRASWLTILVLVWFMTQGTLAVTGVPGTHAVVDDPETEMWSLVRNSLHPADVAAFLQAYPNGKYAPGSPSETPTATTPAGPFRPAGVPLPSPPAGMPEPLSAMRSSIGMELVLIPPGEFMMGSDSYQADERPVHRVVISKPFYLGKYEVTQAAWLEVMGTNPSHFKGDIKRPVERVSWQMVQEFIRRLNAQEGHNKYRLPTEAEWRLCGAGRSNDAVQFWG